MTDALITLLFQETLATIDKDSEMPVAVALQKPSLLMELYTPRDIDNQQPHELDEVYIVARGRAILEVEGEQSRLGVGDAAFVAAQASHRFLIIADDFAVWVVFPQSSN